MRSGRDLIALVVALLAVTIGGITAFYALGYRFLKDLVVTFDPVARRVRFAKGVRL
jgi:hypothetical protein